MRVLRELVAPIPAHINIITPLYVGRFLSRFYNDDLALGTYVGLLDLEKGPSTATTIVTVVRVTISGTNQYTFDLTEATSLDQLEVLLRSFYARLQPLPL